MKLMQQPGALRDVIAREWHEVSRASAHLCFFSARPEVAVETRRVKKRRF